MTPEVPECPVWGEGSTQSETFIPFPSIQRKTMLVQGDEFQGDRGTVLRKMSLFLRKMSPFLRRMSPFLRRMSPQGLRGRNRFWRAFRKGGTGFGGPGGVAEQVLA